MQADKVDKLKDFIKRRAQLLGITVDEVMREADNEDKPEFLKAAESRAARQGLSPDEVLQRDEARLRAPARLLARQTASDRLHDAP